MTEDSNDMPEENNEINTAIDSEELLRVLKALKSGDLSQRMDEGGAGIAGEIARTVNELADMNTLLITEGVRVNKELSVEGKFGTQMGAEGFEGAWKNLVDSTNIMSLILAAQFRNIADVAYSVAHRDMTRRVTIDAQGEMLELKNIFNEMVEQLEELEKAIHRLTQRDNN